MIEVRTWLLQALALTVAVGTLLALNGCALFETTPPPPPPRAYALPPPAPAPRDGSIYSNSTALALFEDQRARHPGDILTVLLVEHTDAAKSAKTTTSKDTSTDIANPTLLGRPLTAGGVGIGGVGLNSSHSFDGAGDSAQSNQLQGSVTVVVQEVLANGNLVIAGQKEILINQGAETVSIEGIVRPLDISPSNTVNSDRVAEAHIAYAGKGAVADSNAAGWLQRFFTSVFFPF